MKKRKITQYMEIEELRRLENDPSSCVERKKFEHHLSLYPAQLSDLKSSIKYLLNNSLAKYDKRKEGILLGYENVRVLGQEGDINYDTCFIHIDVEVDFFIFKPQLGLIVNGVVNKTCSTHIGCLVHNMFNVSVLRPSNDKNWIGQKVVLRHEVKIRITGLQLESRLPYITGEIISILSEDSGISTGEETSPAFNNISYEDIKPNKNQSSSNKKHKQRDSSFLIENELMEDSTNIIKLKTEAEDTNQMNFKKRKIKGEVPESSISFEDETNSFAPVKVEDVGHVKKRRRSKSVCSNNDGYAGDVPLKTIKTERKSNEFSLHSNESNVGKIKEQLNVHYESDAIKDRKQRKRTKSLSKDAPSAHIEREPEIENVKKRIRSKSISLESTNDKHSSDLLIDKTALKIKQKSKLEGVYEQHVESEKDLNEFNGINFIIDTIGNRDLNIKQKQSKSVRSDYDVEENTLDIVKIEQKSPNKEYSSKSKKEKKSSKIPEEESVNIQNRPANLKSEELSRKKKRKLHEILNESEIIIDDFPNQSKKICKSEKVNQKENQETIKIHKENSKFDSGVVEENLNENEVNNEAETPKKHKKKDRSKERDTDEKQQVNVPHDKKHKKNSKKDSSKNDTSQGSLSDLNLGDLYQHVCSPARVPMADDVDKGKKYTRSPHNHVAIVIDTSVAFPEDTSLEEILNSCKKKKKKHKKVKLDEDVVVKVEDLQDSQNLFQQLSDSYIKKKKKKQP